jgi:2-polyprenyl-3-methyl-5-hydroxy-6-metoxy-1,4-benzoquinol methylase
MARKEPDTDAEWTALAEARPYWAVVTAAQFDGPHLSADALEQFRASGDADIGWIHAGLVGRLGMPGHVTSALDFGCGVGRLVIPMAGLADTVVGMDVAPPMLALARAAIQERGLEARVSTAASIDEAVRRAGPFQWVNSYIVLQHIPPSRVPGLVAELAAATAPGGYVSLHLTTATDPQRIRQPNWKGRLRTGIEALLRRAGFAVAAPDDLRMYDHDLNACLQVLRGHGFSRFDLEPTDHGGHLGFVIRSVRAPKPV